MASTADESRLTQSDDDAAHDIPSQENMSARGASRPAKQPPVRHRASVACASCRDRRIRCVVPKGEATCTQCARAGTACVIKNDDERRRPISKAYMSSLSDRIRLLETMLLDRGVVPPPAVHPPRTRQDAQQGAGEGAATATMQPSSVTIPPPPPSTTPYSSFPRPPPPSDGSSARDDTSPYESATSHNGDFHLDDSSAGGDPLERLLATAGAGHALPPASHRAAPAPAPAPFKETSPFRNLDPRREDIVHRLLATKGNLSFDQLSGRLRFFGPTANSHVYAADGGGEGDTASVGSPARGIDASADFREPPEQVRRSERIIRSLTPATHDYLMACFWEYYNAIIYVLDREAFETGRATQNPKFYTSFLHITVLAMGYRFADRSRDDMRKISLGNRESTLQREAKYMLDIELERPGGTPSVQALLLLGDLECGVGRDNTGWMYSGMANRLAFDIGLHLDYGGSGSDDMSAREVRIRRMVMKAAIVIDKYWALFLGRPTSIKSQDIGMDLLTKRFAQLADGLGSSSGSGSGQAVAAGRPAKMSPEEIYEYLFELMELAGKIVESRDMHRLGGTGTGGGGSSSTSDYSSSSPATMQAGGGLLGGGGNITGAAEDHAYQHVISLDRQLQNWYRRLPDHLTWKPANIKAAPMGFFLLHQQYHVSMILLHRPWAKYGLALASDGGSPGSSPATAGSPASAAVPGAVPGGVSGAAHSTVPPPAADSRTMLSRSICTQQAIRVARIFWQHRQRFDGRRICITGIQHAGTAAIALIAALAYQQSSDADRRSYLGYLEILSYALADMSHTYSPAARMDDLLKAVLEQLRSDVYRGGTDGTTQGVPGSATTSTSASTSASASWFGGGAAGAATPTGNNGIDVYSVLPARREHPDSAEAAAAAAAASIIPAPKKRRPTGSRRASEFARPPPPFFTMQAAPSSGGLSGAAGAPSTAAAAAAIAAATAQQQQQLQQLHQLHHHQPQLNTLLNHNSNMMDGFFAASASSAGALSALDFLNGSAIADLDGTDDGARSALDDYVLVPPPPPSAAATGHPLAPHHHSLSQGAYDLPMADWMAGMPPTTTAAALSATAAVATAGLDDGAAQQRAAHGGSPASSSSGGHHHPYHHHANGSSSAASSSGATSATTVSGGDPLHALHPLHANDAFPLPPHKALDGGEPPNHSLDWMDDPDGALHGLSPASLAGLVQSVETVGGGGGGGTDETVDGPAGTATGDGGAARTTSGGDGSSGPGNGHRDVDTAAGQTKNQADRDHNLDFFQF